MFNHTKYTKWYFAIIEMRRDNKGRTVNVETWVKLSKSKLALGLKPWLGRKHSTEILAKMSASAKAKWNKGAIV